MIVFISIFKFDNRCIWFDLSNIKEHFINFLVSVSVWSTQIVSLSFSFLHFKAVKNSKSNVSNINGLNLCIHTINLPVHSVEHFHLHTPFSCDCWILMKEIEDKCWTNNSYIWIDSLDFLFTNPFGSKTL